MDRVWWKSVEVWRGGELVVEDVVVVVFVEMMRRVGISEEVS